MWAFPPPYYITTPPNRSPITSPAQSRRGSLAAVGVSPLTSSQPKDKGKGKEIVDDSMGGGPVPTNHSNTSPNEYLSTSSEGSLVEIIKEKPVVGEEGTSSASAWAEEKGKGKGRDDVVVGSSTSDHSPAIALTTATPQLGDSTGFPSSSSPNAFPSSSTFTKSSTPTPPNGQVQLLFSKSHVYVHPTHSSKDNIPGWLGLASIPKGSTIAYDFDQENASTAGEGSKDGKDQVVLFWIPEVMAEEMKEKEKYEAVEQRRGSAASMAAFHQSGSSGLVLTGDKGKVEIGVGGPGPSTLSGGKSVQDEEDYVFVTLPTKPSISTSDLPPSRRGSISGSPTTNATSALGNSDLDASFLPPSTNNLSQIKAYAFSLPLSQLYSLLVYPPSLRNWYGCVTINLLGGVSLPGLWFHDDESGSTMELMRGKAGTTSSQQPRTGAPWGFTPLHASLSSHSEILKSSLVPNLYLINPSRMDREVHEIDLGDDERNGKVLPGVGGGGAGRARVVSGPASIKMTNSTNTSPSKGSSPTPYPPKSTFPSAFDSPLASAIHPARTQLLSSFSKFTQSAKKLTEQALSQPMFEPFVPLMPEPVRSLVTVPGEWESRGKRFEASLDAANGTTSRRGSAAGTATDDAKAAAAGAKGKSAASVREVAGEYESARVYLARWARVVAEEGERARQADIARQASLSGASTPSHPKESGSGRVAKSELGVFELVKSLRGGEVQPATTRTPSNPVTEKDFQEWHEKGLAESYLRGEVFRRGLSEKGSVRKWVWEVLLGVIAWEVGLQDSTDVATTKRQERRSEQRREYERLKGRWQTPKMDPAASKDDEDSIHESEEQRREEWHRIDLLPIMRDIPQSMPVSRSLLSSPRPTRLPISSSSRRQVDCRRTDRTQAMFMVPEEARGDEEKEGGGASASSGMTGDLTEAEEGSQTALNPHTATLRLILMTYHQYSPHLGYVQGMSDLLSPIYVVFAADEAISFWAFVGWMRQMENNFLRDQSGMKAKLSTLQQLIEVMDPQLYRKLVRTDSLNLFFCFRWILIAFKREFKFEDVIRLWDILFTSYYSEEYVLFIGLAILHSHREVIIRYLIEFDEVLKYANDLSGTIDLESTLAQSEVLFLSFRSLVEQVDRNEAIRIGTLASAAQEAEDEAELRQRSGSRGRRGSLSIGKQNEIRSLSVHKDGGGGTRSRRGSDASVKTARSAADDVRERETRELVSDDLRRLLVGFRDL